MDDAGYTTLRLWEVASDKDKYVVREAAKKKYTARLMMLGMSNGYYRDLCREQTNMGASNAYPNDPAVVGRNIDTVTDPSQKRGAQNKITTIIITTITTIKR